MFSKLLAVITLVGGLSVATARAQSPASRVGPVEDLPAAAGANGGEATKSAPPAPKTDPKKDAKASKDADAKKSVTTEAKREDPKKDDAKVDGRKSEATPAPTATPAAPTSPLATAANIGAAKTEANATTDAPAKSSANPTRESPPVGLIPPPPKFEKPAPLAENANAPTGTTASAENAPPVAPVAPPTSIYRVGVGDMLDIRLVNSTARDSTLYTILTGGLLDYPLAGDPVNVNGLTPDEIGARLSAELKRRGVYDRAQFRVTVRDFVSHTVMVSGLVDQPGHKVLRREAVPLYVVLAEALPRADAGRAVIISRAAGTSRTVDLSDPAALNELVAAGDVINIQARPPEFFYIGGLVGAPGQKDFHAGITLTQAILASGGVARDAGNKVRVTVSRQGADGRLIATDFVLQEIEAGKVPDPPLKPGDRIEIGRSKR
ncbi:MAG TPA: polysaccharide biosynthesis/export family protein [Pyrinomonadaceae bacterium]